MRESDVTPPAATTPVADDTTDVAAADEGAEMPEWITERDPHARANRVGDPPLEPSASLEDVAHARRLRLALRERYPHRPDGDAAPYWWIGVD